MEFTHIRSNPGEVEVKLKKTGEVVLFEQQESIENHEYSMSYAMNGYVGENLKYIATAEFEIGSDDFIELTEIEKV